MRVQQIHKSYDDDVVRARFISVAPISVRKSSKTALEIQIHQPGKELMPELLTINRSVDISRGMVNIRMRA